MIDVEELSCQELVELVTDYLEGALDDMHRTAFERHLDGCDGCTGYLAQFQATIRIAGMLSVDDLSREAESVLMQAFRDWKRTS